MFKATNAAKKAIELFKSIYQKAREDDQDFDKFSFANMENSIAITTHSELLESYKKRVAELEFKLAELKKKIEDAPGFHATLDHDSRYSTDLGVYDLCELSNLKPGETRRFKIVEWKEGAE